MSNGQWHVTSITVNSTAAEVALLVTEKTANDEERTVRVLFKAAAAVDVLIEALEAHRDEVWPANTKGTGESDGLTE